MTSQILTDEKLTAVLDFAIKLAREAGETILRGSEAIAKAGSGAVGEKMNSVDLVTEYDKEVEALMKSRAAAAFPDFGL